MAQVTHTFRDEMERQDAGQSDCPQKHGSENQKAKSNLSFNQASALNAKAICGFQAVAGNRERPPRLTPRRQTTARWMVPDWGSARGDRFGYHPRLRLDPCLHRCLCDYRRPSVCLCDYRRPSPYLDRRLSRGDPRT
jgi:hypothetical protein